MHRVKTLIVGGGIAGASLACSMAERHAGSRTALVDVDLYGKLSSSELNGGGVRCTFAEPLNVKLSLTATRYYREHALAIDYRQRGYLWMYDTKLWDDAHAFLPVVRTFDLPVEELSPQQVKERYNFGDVSDLAGATYTAGDGRLSPHKLRLHYLNRAESGGVQLMDKWQVVAIEGERSPFHVVLQRVKPRQARKALTTGYPTPQSHASADDGAGEETLHIEAMEIVNAAGPWASKLAALYGRELPVVPAPRQVYILYKPELSLEAMPFFIDYPQDIYFRHYEYEQKHCILVSWSDPQEPNTIDFTFRGQAYYERHVKPRLTRRLPGLSDAQCATGWAGHYELSPDKGVIIGAVPDRHGIYNYNGLSAHGVMQSRALGDALATYLVNQRWPIGLDLSAMSEARFAQRPLTPEKMYV